MDGSEVRRGLQLALRALGDAASQAQPDDLSLTDAQAKLATALADLDQGALAQMDTLIEEVRTSLA